MTDAEIAIHRSAVEELLQDKTCKSFVEGVLAQIGDAQRKAFKGDLLTIFDKAKALKGWATAPVAHAPRLDTNIPQPYSLPFRTFSLKHPKSNVQLVL